MAQISTIIDNDVPAYNSGISSLQVVQSWSATQADNADRVDVWTVPVGAKKRLTGAQVRVSATLGAGCTVQLRVNRGGSFTVLTAATTAGGASKVTDVAQAGMPFDLEGGDIIELLVGGADVAAAATVTTDLFLANRQ